MNQQNGKPRALLVCHESPYPVVVGGYERTVIDYQAHVLSDYDTHFLLYRREEPCQLFHYGRLLDAQFEATPAFADTLEFALFVGCGIDFEDEKILGAILGRTPCFCFMERHPWPDVPDSLFKGILTHRSTDPHPNVMILNGAYDSEVFVKRRMGEEFVVCVGRIHPAKNQLELVRNYRKRIYDTYRLPLHLIGGSADPDYFPEVLRHVDNVAVFCTATDEGEDPYAEKHWRTAREIAEICNRARMFVMPSPRESFGIAMIEAMACGLTCVVNGEYDGFQEAELRPHVYGHITGKRGSILKTLDEALRLDVRIDASDWVRRYSLKDTVRKVMPFITTRLTAKQASCYRS